jgi:tetratricopeptide (TPR) repeat protein
MSLRVIDSLKIAVNLMIASVLSAESLADLLAAHRYTEALRAVESLIKDNPADPRLWTVRGMALGGLKKIEDGLASYDRALRIQPSFLAALKAASETAYASRHTRAGLYLGRLLEVDPTSEPAHAMAAVLAFEAHDCRKSIGHFKASLNQIRGSEIASAQYGYCLLELGDTEGAAETLLPLAQSRDPGILNLVAAAQDASGRAAQAISTLRTAISLAPKDERHYLDLAVVYQKSGALVQSVEVLDAALREIPKSARLFAMRGVMLAQLGELDKSEADFERAGLLEPDQTYSAAGLSVLFTETGRAEGAAKLVRRKLAQSPDDPALNYVLADALLREGAQPGQAEFTEAKTVLVRAVRTRPNFARAHAALGKIYAREGNASEAIRELNLALKLDPANRPALSQLATVLRQAGRTKEAADAAEQLRRQYERDLEAESRRQRLRLTPESEPGRF